MLRCDAIALGDHLKQSGNGVIDVIGPFSSGVHHGSDGRGTRAVGVLVRIEFCDTRGRTIIQYRGAR